MEKEEGAVNASRGEETIYIYLVGQVMSMDSPMLGSMYSCIKEPLRKL
jgi:hypothetical protein